MLKGKIIAGKYLVKPVAANEKTQGGIFIPDSAKETSTYGEVVLIGELLPPPTPKGDEKKESGIKSGDKIIYGKYAGTKLEIDGEEYILIAYEDILYVY